jgi:biopolymer transport protein ExbD
METGTGSMKRFDQINVIPFIDIMLVLLAIVLMTATFIAQGKIDIDVPEAANSESLKQEEAREIAIDELNQFYFDETLVTQQELGDRLQDLSPNTSIILRVDKKVAFENFIKVIDLLKTNQLEQLSIITRQQ